MARSDSTVATADSAAVVGMLREWIAAHGLGPGDRLPPIRELSSKFGVKAGTVRDALLDAQGKGLVKVLPRVGAIVQMTVDGETASRTADLADDLAAMLASGNQNLFHVLETRETLELAMVVRAAQRRQLPELFQLRQILEEMATIPFDDPAETPRYAELDVRFHLEVARLSGNTVMSALLKVLLQEIRPHLDRIRWSSDRRAGTHESHVRIYSALVAGDVEMAQREMQEHIRAAYDSLLDELRKPPMMPE